MTPNNIRCNLKKGAQKTQKKNVDAVRLNVNQKMMLANVSLRKVRFENL